MINCQMENLIEQQEEYSEMELSPVPTYDGEITLASEGMENALSTFKDITESVCASITSWKQIDLEMHRMDITFNSMIAKLDYDLDKYRASLPVVERQLDFVNQQIGRIMDHVLTMDATTESEMNMKMRLLDSAENYLDKLSSMMMKLV